MMRATPALLTALLLAACGDPYATAKDAVRDRLKDPESARFGEIWAADAGAVCGYVNARTPAGGYGGEEPFVFKSPMTVVGDGWAHDFDAPMREGETLPQVGLDTLWSRYGCDIASG